MRGSKASFLMKRPRNSQRIRNARSHPRRQRTRTTNFNRSGRRAASRCRCLVGSAFCQSIDCDNDGSTGHRCAIRVRPNRRRGRLGIFGLPRPARLAGLCPLESVAFGTQKVDLGQHPRQQGFGRQGIDPCPLSWRISLRWRPTWTRIRSISALTTARSGIAHLIAMRDFLRSGWPIGIRSPKALLSPIIWTSSARMAMSLVAASLQSWS